MSIMERLTAFFAPDDCLGCGREGSLLCSACLPTLPALTGRCFGCHKSIIGAGCEHCIKLIGLDALIAAADYTGTAKQLVSRLKFVGNQAAARIMSDCLTSTACPASADVVTHVPATTSHIRQRGYDQSALIARHVGNTFGKPNKTLLYRTSQAHQLGADREERLRQLKGTVRSKGLHSSHQTIILCDDVLTTGASLLTSASALRLAGAKHVVGLIFAQSVK